MSLQEQKLLISPESAHVEVLEGPAGEPLLQLLGEALLPLDVVTPDERVPQEYDAGPCVGSRLGVAKAVRVSVSP